VPAGLLHLLIKAQYAATRPYKRTEVWLMLEPANRPPGAVAQRLIGNALRDAFRDYALHFARASALALALGLITAPYV
jgi:hypothetical protein